VGQWERKVIPPDCHGLLHHVARVIRHP
jgi:hypothetical protein